MSKKSSFPQRTNGKNFGTANLKYYKVLEVNPLLLFHVPSSKWNVLSSCMGWEMTLDTFFFR